MSNNSRENAALESKARGLLAEPPGGDFIAALRLVLKMRHLRGGITLSQAARLADMSDRTLERRLNAQGLSYSKLIEEARIKTAMEMLKNKELLLNEIAKAIGYSALSNFTRAFQRWTGKTPSEFRRGDTSADDD